MSINLFDLKGKVALITGAVHGLGMAMAKGLGNAGATIVVNNHSKESLEKAIEEYKSCGIEAHGFIFDVTDEKAVVKSCSNPNYQIEIGKEVLNIDPNYFRPTEVDLLVGDPSKAKEKLGWKAEIHLEELIQEMVLSDLKQIKE